MKKLFLLIIVISVGVAASAQFENTKWRGIANVPEPYDCMFDFRKDTVYLLAGEFGVIETMKYVISGDTLVFTKIDGKSPCAKASAGYFKIDAKGDSFKLTSLKDDCPGRAEAFVAGPWVRRKD
ncbi:hypothetical protein LZZ85_22150 [Terrimonas sp. NA20]|uniref:Uncharacterized protein n=1 Tax=Terrimonas ginsenosidimutans TaxID=2908004 RepID=A0ABS9KXE6_9BACT|nr:hypothetical protein [Terrimonas ginsenosidimutans]MCG2617014.1 hypothetical protein [Terrimonas ginsenosidimutans]